MTKLTSRSYLLLLACALFWLATSSVAWACPNCRDALAGDPAQAGMVRGLFWSIMFLLSMPFLITAGLGAYFYWLISRARKQLPVVSIPQASSPIAESVAAESNDAKEELEVANV